MVSYHGSGEGDYSDFDSDTSTTSEDESEFNIRLVPVWDSFRTLFEERGYHLDTCRDVRQFYLRYWESRNMQSSMMNSAGYSLALKGEEDELCRDPGFPDRLFRGVRISDGVNIVIKAVHQCSEEFDITRKLSTSPLRDYQTNHCIPVLDLLEVPDCDTAFIIMEEWSSHIIPEMDPSYLTHELFSAMRQCIEHIAFMHSQNMVHLDISVRNVLTDSKGHYAFIDHECSRILDIPFDANPPPRICHFRATEIPPESDRLEPTDPYKADVWALGILIQRACLATGYENIGLCNLISSMLHPCFELRPSMEAVLKGFNCMAEKIPRDDLLYQDC